MIGGFIGVSILLTRVKQGAIPIQAAETYMRLNLILANREWGIASQMGKLTGLDAMVMMNMFSKPSLTAANAPRTATEYPIFLPRLFSLNRLARSSEALKKINPYDAMKR